MSKPTLRLTPEDAARLSTRFEIAFKDTAADRAVLPKEALIAPNLDVKVAITTALGTAARVQQLKSEASKLPDFDVRVFERLETYALALVHAESQYMTSGPTRRAAGELATRAAALRKRLKLDARALCQRGLLNPKSLEGLKARRGLRNTAADLVALVALFRTHWEQIDGRTALTLTELDVAEETALQLLASASKIRRPAAQRAQAREQRERAFALLLDAYGAMRRAVIFLRWKHGDADEFAPSLYAKNQGATRRTASSSASANPRSTKSRGPKKLSNPRGGGPKPGTYRAFSARVALSSLDSQPELPTLTATQTSLEQKVDLIMSISVNPGTLSDPSSEARSFAAYKRLLPQIESFPVEQLVPITIDIPTAITMVLGSLPEIRNMRASIAEGLHGFDLTLLDNLEDYTQALTYASGLSMSAAQPAAELPALAEAGATKREVLLADTKALIARGLLQPESISGLSGTVGYRNIAMDLIALIGLLRANLPQIASKSAVTAAELDEANRVADELLNKVGQKTQGPSQVGASAEIRQKAFSLFITAYDQVRRAIHYLRWQHGDAESIAPSLYAGRKRKPVDVVNNASAHAAPGTDVPLVTQQTAQSTANAGNASAQPGVAVSPIVPVGPGTTTLPNTPGLPGSNPFSA